jgi:SSS family solute:Na+ symporter
MLRYPDYAVIAVYMLLMIALGVVAKRKVRNAQDYFAAGKRVPWWLGAISHHMSGYSAFAYVGYADIAYRLGFNIWTLFALPCAIGIAFGAFVWAPRWAKMTILTPVEYLEKRFNNLVRQLTAWSGIALKFVDEGIKIYALGLILATCSGLPLEWMIILCGLVSLVYVAFGGLWANILTDFAQFVVQFSITLLLVPLTLGAVGGWSNMWAQLPPTRGALFTSEYGPGYIFVFLIVITLSYNGGTWGLAQKYYSLRGPREATKAALLSSFLYLVYPLAIYTPVWAAPLLGVSVENGEQSYIAVAEKLLHGIAPGLMGLLLSAMCAATMSMVCSDLNALAAVFTRDIYQRTMDPKASDRRLLAVGVISTAVLGAIMIAFGLATPKLGGSFKAMMDWYAALLGPVSVPLLMGMLWRRTTWRGALGAWAGGVAAFLITKYAFGAGWAVYTGVELFVTFAVFFGEGFVFHHTPEEQKRVDEVFAQWD